MGPAGSLPAHFTTRAIRSVSQLPKALWGCKDALWLWFGNESKEARECVFKLCWYAKNKGKKIQGGSQARSSWCYHEKKCLFMTREQICESQNLSGSFQWCVRISFFVESLLSSTMSSGCNCRHSHLVLTSSPHSAWQAWVLKGGWDLGPPGSCKELPDVHRRLSHSEGQSWTAPVSWFLFFLFFSWMYLARYTPQFGNLAPY